MILYHNIVRELVSLFLYYSQANIRNKKDVSIKKTLLDWINDDESIRRSDLKEFFSEANGLFSTEADFDESDSIKTMAHKIKKGREIMPTSKLQLEIRDILCQRCSCKTYGFCNCCWVSKAGKEVYQLITGLMRRYTEKMPDWAHNTMCVDVKKAFDYLKNGGL